MLLFILPFPVRDALGKYGPEKGEGYKVPVNPLSFATSKLSQGTYIHPDKQLIGCGSPTFPFVCGVSLGTTVITLHGVFVHAYASILYL